MDLEYAGMLAAGGVHAGRTVLGSMWLAASPNEAEIERAMRPVGMSAMESMAQNSQWATWHGTPNVHSGETENPQIELQEEQFEPDMEFSEEGKPFPNLNIFGITNEPKENETKFQESTRRRVDTSFSRFGQPEDFKGFRKRKREGTYREGQVSDAHERDAEDVTVCKPETRLKGKKQKLKPNDWKSLMMDSTWTKKAKEKLKSKLFAASTSATREAKRRKIKDIMDSCGFTKFHLVGLDPDQLLTIAAVLGEMGLRSADQYIGETKLMQLELGVSWSDVMERQLTMLKRALRRDKGPETRATEVPLVTLDDILWERRDNTPGVPCRIAWSYAWATVWMLRSVEAAAVRTKDVFVKHKSKTVTLNIRKSKTDQSALGVKRTLKCCGEEVCSRFCPWNMAIRALAEHTNDKLYLFPDSEGCQVPKVKMVKSWMENINETMSGHSARRSGAMMYARRGTPVQEIAMLGRWKSSCVFRYIEEAVQDIPLNNFRESQQTPKAPRVPLETEEDSIAKLPKVTTKEVKKQVSVNVTPVVPEEIWVVSTARSRRVSHRVRQASWDLRLSFWDTWCGWHFADRNVKVSMTNRFQTNTVKCKKCEAAKSSRDFVSGGVSLAQLVTLKDGKKASNSTAAL